MISALHAGSREIITELLAIYWRFDDSELNFKFKLPSVFFGLCHLPLLFMASYD